MWLISLCSIKLHSYTKRLFLNISGLLVSEHLEVHYTATTCGTISPAVAQGCHKETRALLHIQLSICTNREKLVWLITGC